MKRIICSFILCIVFLCGCSNYEVKETTKNQYDGFLAEFHNRYSEVDINSQIIKFVEDTSNISEIQYSVKECKLDDSYGDLIVKIDFKICTEKKSILCIFKLYEGQLAGNVFSELHNFISFEVVDILHNNTQQIVYITDDSGNGYTFSPIQILSYDANKEKMSVIFDEILYGYNYLGFKTTKETEYYSISFENSYQFENTDDNTSIIFNSSIFEKEDAIIDTGCSVFKYNGEKYIADNYYDYKKISKQIFDNAD